MFKFFERGSSFVNKFTLIGAMSLVSLQACESSNEVIGLSDDISGGIEEILDDDSYDIDEELRSIDYSSEYTKQDVELALAHLDELRMELIDVCKFDFDEKQSASQRLGLINSVDFYRLNLENYLLAYSRAAQVINSKLVDLKYKLDVVLEQKGYENYAYDLHVDIVSLQSALLVFDVNADYMTLYPELNVFLKLNLVLLKFLKNPFLILKKGNEAEYKLAIKSYIDEFFMLRRERLVNELNFVSESEELKWSDDVDEILKLVFDQVDWSDYQMKLIFHGYDAPDITRDLFMESDLADSLRVSLRDFVQRGYRITPQITLVDGFNSADGMAPFSMYEIEFLISNGPTTKLVKPVNVRDYYHPLLHGKKQYKNMRPLQAVGDLELSDSAILKDVRQWDGDLNDVPDISGSARLEKYFNFLTEFANRKELFKDRNYFTQALMVNRVYDPAKSLGALKSIIEDQKSSSNLNEVFAAYQAEVILDSFLSNPKFKLLKRLLIEDENGYSPSLDTRGRLDALAHAFYFMDVFDDESVEYNPRSHNNDDFLYGDEEMDVY